jgi:hypothetical protein
MTAGVVAARGATRRALFVAVLVVALAACGGGSSSGPSDASKPGPGVAMTLPTGWTSSTSDGELIFTAGDPTIRIVVRRAGEEQVSLSDLVDAAPDANFDVRGTPEAATIAGHTAVAVETLERRPSGRYVVRHVVVPRGTYAVEFLLETGESNWSGFADQLASIVSSARFE